MTIRRRRETKYHKLLLYQQPDRTFVIPNNYIIISTITFRVDRRRARTRLWKSRTSVILTIISDVGRGRGKKTAWYEDARQRRRRRRRRRQRATDKRRLQTDPCDWRENFVTYIPGGPPPRNHRPAGHPNGAAVASNRFPRARGGNRQGGVHTTHVTRTLSRSAATESRVDRSSTVAPTTKTPPKQPPCVAL